MKPDPHGPTPQQALAHLQRDLAAREAARRARLDGFATVVGVTLALLACAAVLVAVWP